MDVTVVCMKWGDGFAADYVNVLRQAVRANLSIPHEFVCLTDDATGIADGVSVRPIPDMGIPDAMWWTGCWPKLSIFKPGVLDPERPVLYLDLDIMVRASLDPFFETLEKERGLHIIREWNYGLWQFVPLDWRPDRGGNSSIVAFFPGEQKTIYETFMADQEAAFRGCYNDQRFITKFGSRVGYWPYSWSASFRRDCVWYYPFNLVLSDIKEPEEAKVVVFHGRPKPVDLIRDDNSRWGTSRKFGHGPVGWVKDYWRSALAEAARPQ